MTCPRNINSIKNCKSGESPNHCLRYFFLLLPLIWKLISGFLTNIKESAILMAKLWQFFLMPELLYFILTSQTWFLRLNFSFLHRLEIFLQTSAIYSYLNAQLAATRLISRKDFDRINDQQYFFIRVLLQFYFLAFK